MLLRSHLRNCCLIQDHKGLFLLSSKALRHFLNFPKQPFHIFCSLCKPSSSPCPCSNQWPQLPFIEKIETFRKESLHFQSSDLWMGLCATCSSSLHRSSKCRPLTWALDIHSSFLLDLTVSAPYLHLSLFVTACKYALVFPHLLKTVPWEFPRDSAG